MKYTREQIIKSIEALRNYCIDTRCEDCEFSVNNEKCKLDGLPANWCIPARHPSKKKIVPFDFSLEEDRNSLRDRWIISKETGSETRIQSFTKAGDGFWTVDLFIDASWISTVPSVLLEDYVFADGKDKGKPVGKEVIE